MPMKVQGLMCMLAPRQTSLGVKSRNARLMMVTLVLAFPNHLDPSSSAALERYILAFSLAQGGGVLVGSNAKANFFECGINENEARLVS